MLLVTGVGRNFYRSLRISISEDTGVLLKSTAVISYLKLLVARQTEFRPIAYTVNALCNL